VLLFCSHAVVAQRQVGLPGPQAAADPARALQGAANTADSYVRQLQRYNRIKLLAVVASAVVMAISVSQVTYSFETNPKVLCKEWVRGAGAAGIALNFVQVVCVIFLTPLNR
jgi:hypothetical protein